MGDFPLSFKALNMKSVETIKNLFNYCLMSTIYLSDKINELSVEEYYGMYNLQNNLKCHQYVFDIYDAVETSRTHYGSFNLEVTVEDDKINKIVMFTQVYGLPYVLEFNDFKNALYDMIERRNKFSK